MKGDLNIINEIIGCGDKEYENSLIFTYNCNLVFYETIILNPLWNKGCYNNLIVMDHGQYDVLVQSEKNKVGYCGSRYVCERIRPNKGVFHPKMILLTGGNKGKLFIGSGNNTFPGYGRNYELFYKFEYGELNREYLGLFQQVVGTIEQLGEEYTFGKATKKRIKTLKDNTPWLNGRAEKVNEKFIHNLKIPILDQILEEVPKDTNRIILVAPYFDGKLETIQKLRKLFPKAIVNIITQSGNTNFPIEYFLSKREAFPDISLYKIRSFDGERRALHGKFLYFSNGKKELFFSGSPNISSAALDSKAGEGNVENGILLVQDSKNDLVSIWTDFAENKDKIETAEDLETQKIEYIPGKEEMIRLSDAYLENQRIQIDYVSKKELSAELYINDIFVSKIKIASSGNFSVPLAACPVGVGDCFFVQVKAGENFSNLLWVNDVFIKRVVEKTEATKQLNSLSRYIKDSSRARWIIELSPDLQWRSDRDRANEDIIKALKQSEEEESGKSIELPPEKFIVESRPEWQNFLQQTKDPERYKRSDQFLESIFSILSHAFKRNVAPSIANDRGDATVEPRDVVVESAEEEEDILEVVKERITRKINQLMSQEIEKLEDKNLRLELNCVLDLVQFLAFLVWTLEGIDIMGDAEDEFDRVSPVDSQKYIDTSVRILERMWLKTSKEDYLENKKEESDVRFLEQSYIFPLSVFLVSFNNWVLKKDIEYFLDDVEKYQDRLIDIYFAIRKKIGELPRSFLNECFSDVRMENINKKLVSFSGFNLGKVNFKDLVKKKYKKDQVILMLKKSNIKREQLLLVEKEDEIKELNKMCEYCSRMLGQGNISALTMTLYEIRLADGKKKLKEVEKIISEINDSPKIKIGKIEHLDKNAAIFFHFK